MKWKWLRGAPSAVRHTDQRKRIAMVIGTWADLVDELDKALTFARNDLGLSISGTRFAAFRDRLSELDAFHKTNGDAPTLTRFKADIEHNAVALTDSQEFVTVVAYLRSVPTERAKKKMQVVLQGPELPVDEDGNSSEARNTMFELNLAARIQRAGMTVDIGGDADLEFMCKGVRWFGECKRPYKVETIANNIGEVCRQLGERLKTSRLAARGLLAISVSRPLTTRSSYLEYSSEAELRHSLKEHVSNIVRTMQEQMEGLERCREPRGSLGLLIAHLAMPAWNVRTGLPVGIQYSAGTDIGPDRRGDGQQVWELIDKTFTR